MSEGVTMVGELVCSLCLPKTPKSAGMARDAAAKVLGEHVCWDEIALVISELVGNSVKYADEKSDRIALELRKLGDDSIRIEVHEVAGSSFPHVIPPDDENLGGRGLYLISEIARAWGYVDEGTERVVWVELPQPSFPRGNMVVA